MRIHRINYVQSGVKHQEFASSDAEASKRCTALKMATGVTEKPTRKPVDVPTDKAGLIEWLNQHAKLAS